MTELTYTAAKMIFPGSLLIGSNPDEPYVVFDKLRFMRNDCYIEAHISPYCLPHGQSKNCQVQEEIIKPGIALISKDLETIDDLLGTLQDLWEQVKIQDNLFFHRDPKGALFKVYDYSTSGSKQGELFEKLLRFKGMENDVDVLDSAYRQFPSMAANVSKEEGKTVHVEGNTLKEAVLRAIDLYFFADQIKSIPEKSLKK